MNEENTETVDAKEEDVKFRLHTIISDQDMITLRKESDPVSPDELQSDETKELIQALKDYVLDNDGLGMAAVQLGITKRVFVMRQPYNTERLITVINPRIIRGEGKANGVENCFSIDNVPAGVQGAVVRRQSRIFVEFTDEEGTLHTEELYVGMDARIFQHEYDHLFGCLILDDNTPTGKFQGWRRSF